MEIQIIQATINDYREIREMTRITWMDTYPNVEAGITREDVESEFLTDDTKEGRKRQEARLLRYVDPTWVHYVAKNDNKIVGFFIGRKEADFNRLIAIYVLPEYQHQGIGIQLIEKGLEWLGNEKDIYVNVASYNKKAQAFYEKYGFKFTGREVSDAHRPLPTGKVIPEVEMVLKGLGV
jgi:ribosomal protein S18 acetylase RimI-like enzyme